MSQQCDDDDDNDDDVVASTANNTRHHSIRMLNERDLSVRSTAFSKHEFLTNQLSLRSCSAKMVVFAKIHGESTGLHLLKFNMVNFA